MINKKDILKMARAVTKRTRGKPERKEINPQREWFIGIALFVLITVGGGVINAQRHIYFDTLDTKVTVETVGVQKYHSDNVQSAISLFESKQRDFESLAATYQTFSPVSTTTEEVGEEVESSEADPESESGEGTGEVDQDFDLVI